MRNGHRCEVRAYPGVADVHAEDILGYETIVEELDGTRKIHFKPGKLMAHIVLIDEDNRLSGKTKAAVPRGYGGELGHAELGFGNLAEGKTLPLFPLSCDYNDITGPRFFIVICTENIFGERKGRSPTRSRSSTERPSPSACWTRRAKRTS